ncbi:uncharacterized protein [Dermacentor andersoni]|uniref:uncharacterized protein n=1 Tax=Dermacentor andersoni TaxID=34620 RepID=UPI0024161EF6|nr:uncharacterized protein LOC126544405 [Dermacentor andersoni]
MEDASQMSQLSEMSTASTSPSDRMAHREQKRMIVRTGIVVIILLLIIDAILLYLWLTAEPKVIYKKVTKEDLNRRLFQPFDLDPRDTDDTLLLLEGLSFPSTDTSSDHRHRQGMCNSSGCLWLQGYLRGRNSGLGHIHSQSQKGGRPGPCDDFHEHVCGARRHSLYRDGVARLMAAVAERLTGRLRVVPGIGSGRAEAAGTGDPDEDHAIVLERCLEGGAVITKDNIMSTCGQTRGEDCPPSFPYAPLGITERFFRSNRSASIDDFAAFVQSLAPNLRSGGHSNSSEVGLVRAFPRRWISTACRWVELSARCHLERSLQSRGSAGLALYQQLWKLLYFAPFLGSQARPLVKAAYQEPPDPQLQACVRFIDDAFRQKTTQAARATLSEAVDGLHDTVAHFVWEARQRHYSPRPSAM